MGVLSFMRDLMGSQQEPHELSTTLDDATAALFNRASTSSTYTLPTVKEALGVPAIHRAVALIASTTGMLSMQGYQNGTLMPSPPRLIVRPDPYGTPYSFYAGTAAQFAKWGEFVWWIATHDTDGLPAALQLVPLHELSVTAGSNRLRPVYQWRSIDGGFVQGTRYSPVTPAGSFVHVMYPLGEPYDLRGQGPLQLCNAAASVSVEAQKWAAQFFADGGDPSVLIKHAGYLDPTLDENGQSEADRLRAQWVNRPHNVPRIVDQSIESVDYKTPSPQGAQMLEARQYEKGDAAEMYGIPGSLLEYQSPGSSLTYQNLEGEFTKFVRACLQPLYLEPIEQAMSDLLTRTTVGRFNVKGFLRADAKTRWEIYQIMVAVLGPVQAAQIAATEEGILPGDVEFAPVPFSPPTAVPTRIASLEMREVRCPQCQRLVVRAAGPVEGWCRHCKADVHVA